MKNSFLSAARTNPVSWWLLGIAFTICASLTHSAVMLLGFSVLSVLIVMLCRDESPWAKSIGFYLKLAGVVILIRLLFRILFNLEGQSLDPILVLPSFDFDLGNGSYFHLLGSISRESLNFALVDGLRLATIILAFGMANSLANPRKLLKATPGALYEIAAALSIAINLAPQLITSLNRVRKARGLRGQSKGIKALPGLVIPVLEDTIDQTMSLAASMSARGFGRKGQHSKLRQNLTRLAGLSSSVFLSVGIFLLLLNPKAQIPDIAVIGTGLLCAFLYIKMSSAVAHRTRYRKDPWRLGDLLLISCSIALFALSFSGVFTS